MKTTANFNYTSSASDARTIHFTNQSANGVEFIWNSVDGSSVSKLKSRVHVYTSAGQYRDNLDLIGINGSMDFDTYSEAITIL